MPVLISTVESRQDVQTHNAMEKQVNPIGLLWQTPNPGWVEWEGLKVFRGLRLEVDRNTKLLIRLISANPPPLMCLYALGYECWVEVGGDVSRGSHLWWGEVPVEGIMVQFRRLRPGSSVMVWPGWVQPNGNVASGYGNYGVLIDELSDGHYRLRCAHGLETNPTFNDLIGEVKVFR